jgi:transposase
MEAADSGFVRLRTQIPAIQRLVRIVAALPLHQFMSLNQAFAEAKSRLGSGDLTAHDLTQHARGRRLTVAARRILPDGTEQVLIFRSAYWRYFAILPPSSDFGAVRVRGRTILPGTWYCFVGRRRFDQLYSTAPPSVSTVQKPPSTPQLTDVQIEKWINDVSRPRAHREIRRFAVEEFDDWRSVSTAAIIKAARDSAEFKKRVRSFPSENTFNRALDRKRS